MRSIESLFPQTQDLNYFDSIGTPKIRSGITATCDLCHKSTGASVVNTLPAHKRCLAAPLVATRSGLADACGIGKTTPACAILSLRHYLSRLLQNHLADILSRARCFPAAICDRNSTPSEYASPRNGLSRSAF